MIVFLLCLEKSGKKEEESKSSKLCDSHIYDIHIYTVFIERICIYSYIYILFL